MLAYVLLQRAASVTKTIVLTLKWFDTYAAGKSVCIHWKNGRKPVKHVPITNLSALLKDQIYECST